MLLATIMAVSKKKNESRLILFPFLPPFQSAERGVNLLFLQNLANVREWYSHVFSSKIEGENTSEIDEKIKRHNGMPFYSLKIRKEKDPE